MSEKPSSKPEPSPFDKMRMLAKQVVNTPKSVADERDREWKRKQSERRTC
jgi:hypothetical protein